MNPSPPNRAAPSRTRAASLLLGAAALLLPLSALASTAANTTIVNTATVNYQDAGGVAQTAVTASASVTVTLVPSALNISSPANQSIAQGTSATLTYTVTGTANGFDTYNLSSSVTPSANNSSVSGALPASITLGGTTVALATANGDTTLTVPYDGVASNATINGIAAGTGIIVVSGQAFTVASIVKNAGANTAVITLASAGGGPSTVSGVIAAGTIVGERKTFTETVPSGTLTSGSSGTQTVSTTATSATLGSATATQATPTVITVNRPTLTVTKTVSTDGVTFGATANQAPGQAVFYKIVATNGGATSAQNVAFTDVLPAYLTYVAGSGKMATASATAYSAATTLTDNAAGYTISGSTITYNPGGATGTVAGTGGVLVLFFKATIN